MSLIVTASILVLLIIIVILFLFHLEQVKYTKRLEGRIEVLSFRIQSMKNKELDTVLKSMKYKDELHKLSDEMYRMTEASEDGRQVKLLPRAYLDKPNKLMTYEWQNGDTRYTSHYTQTGSQTSSSENTPSQDSSSYSGGGGDFSGGGSGGSWD